MTTSFTDNILNFIKTHQNESDKILKEKLKSFIDTPTPTQPENYDFIYKNVPEVEWFKSLTEMELDNIRNKDNQARSYHYQLIFKACVQNKSTELIKFLIEKNFKPSVWETSVIVENQNFSLIEYYHNNNIVEPGSWNMHCYRLAIKNNRKDILEYLLIHKLVQEEELQCALHMAVDECLSKDSIEYMSCLLEYKYKDVKTYIEKFKKDQITLFVQHLAKSLNRFQ